MIKLKLIGLLLCLSPSLGLAQNNENILVKIGDKSITVEEFKYRYEFTPQVNRKYADESKSREELLYTLIAENLFAAEAENLEMDSISSFKNNYIPLEKMYVRDALYKQMISDKVKLNTEKFNEGLTRANKKLFVDFVYANEKKDIEEAYELLRSSPNFDSLVGLLNNAEYVSDPYEVSYGKMYYHAEDAIYNLQMNEFTSPIESPEGWYIFRLIGQVPVTFSNNDQRNSLVTKVVEDRVEDSIYNEFWTDFFSGKKISTDGDLFWYLSQEIQKIVISIKEINGLSDGEKIALSNEDFSKLKSNLHPDSLNKPFIRFEGAPVSLEDFLNNFAFEGFYTFTTDLNQIASQINSRVKRQIELELLAKEAYKEGLQNLPDVEVFTDIWKENYLATLYKKKLVFENDLSDADIKEYLKENQNSGIVDDKVNILELLTDSLEIIKQALDLSSNDSELRTFIIKHTKRDWVREKEGEFGFFPVSEYGEIGRIAANMEIGDVYGPLQTEEGYSLFKVIGKMTDSLDIDPNALSEELKTKIRYLKVKDFLEGHTADLAEKYNVTINKSLLNSLDLLNAQMVVYRYMGFGGRIQAFPYSSPFFDWREKWEQKKKDIL